MIKHKSTSILKKLMTMIMLAALLQALLAAGIIMATNVSKTLVENAYSIFAEKNENRKAYIESDMINRWSNILDYRSKILSIYDTLAANQETLSEEEKLLFLQESTPMLIDMFKFSKATGGYIILNDATSAAQSNTGVYITSANPEMTANSPEDLQLIRGPVEIAKENKIAMATMWSYGILLENSAKDILQQPINATKLTDNIKHLGYWSVIPSLKDKSMRVLTYTQPLIDQKGNAFGVIGIEISTEYFYRFLPIDEFAGSGSYGYSLVSFDEETDTVTPLMTRGTAQKSILSMNQPMKLSPNTFSENMYNMPTTNGDVCVYVDRLALYVNNSPYSSNQLYLMGMSDSSNMTDFAQNLNRALILMVLLIVMVGFAFSYFAAYGLVRPIIKLYKEVSQKKVGTIVSLPRANIRELDNLSIAIENLNEKIINSVSNTDKILQMAKIGVGSYEYKKGDKIIKTSTSLQKMLEIAPTEDSVYTVTSSDFFCAVDKLKLNPEAENENTYGFVPSDGPNDVIWYRISEIDDDDDVIGVVIDVTKEILERRALSYQRDYDVLTGIHNRLAFHRIALSIFTKSEFVTAALVMFDLDNLKFINDTYGHELGDFYITTAAQLINATLKKYAVVGRMSGDEFYSFIYGLDSKEQVLALLNTLYKTLEEHPIMLPNNSKFKIRISGGLAWYGDDSKDFEELIRFADFAMYEGKHTVKGELRAFNKQKYLEDSYMLVGKEELNRILDEEFVEFVFQPIVDAKTGSIYGYESLMRPQSELINSPLKLLQISSAQSCLWKVEKITFFKTMSTYMKYKELFGEAKIFINSIPSETLREQEYENFEHLYADELHNIVVEIIETEKTILSNLATKLQSTIRWNAMIALDDYGTGYNNDLSLLQMHPHIVKIDKSLIDDIETDTNRQAMVMKIVNFCKESGILILAEGIETYEQLKYLLSIGIDLLQGYYVSYPLLVPNFDHSQIKAEIEALQEHNE